MKRATVLFISVFLMLGSIFLVNDIEGWFGAGRTPGWPHTTEGLAGEIPLPSYKFSPDFYEVGDTMTVTGLGFNEGDQTVEQPFYFVVSKVIESPTGSNVEDGEPDSPGLNENQLYDNHNEGNDIQEIIWVDYLGEFVFEPGRVTELHASYLTDQPGYFQFDFIAIDPTQNYEPGHILAAGFIRVLDLGNDTPEQDPTPAPITDPTQSPSPTPGSNDDDDSLTPNPTSEPTQTTVNQPTPTPFSNVGSSEHNRNSRSDESTVSQSDDDANAAVLGATSLADTGVKSGLVLQAMLLALMGLGMKAMAIEI